MRIINTHRAFAIALVALVSACGGIAKADFYGLSADWSDAVNPNGVWSYLVNGAAPSISYTRGGDSFDNPPGSQPIWAHSNGAYFGWSKSNGSNSNPWDLQVGDVFGHTLSALEIRWTSPLGGPIDVSGGVWAIRDNGRTNNWQLTLNESLLSDGSVYSGDAYDRSNPAPIDLNFNVNVGDVVAFSAWPSGTGDYIALDLGINVVPAPGAALLGMLGLCVAGVKLRKFA